MKRGQGLGIVRAAGWLAVAGMLVTAAVAPSGALAAPGAGAIWTTNETCTDPAAQDDNHYAVGETVHIRGSNFEPDEAVGWTIAGNPGGSSGDPGQVVASGTTTTDGTGYFCVAAYTVAQDDWGTYTVDVDQGTNRKNDNYRVLAADETPPPEPTPTPEEPTPTPEEPTPTPEEPTPTPEEPTPTPEEPTPTPVESPTGGVAAATGTPRVTLPPTDLPGSGGAVPSSDAWRLLLVAAAGLLASVLILTPSRAAGRRG